MPLDNKNHPGGLPAIPDAILLALMLCITEDEALVCPSCRSKDSLAIGWNMINRKVAIFCQPCDQALSTDVGEGHPMFILGQQLDEEHGGFYESGQHLLPESAALIRAHQSFTTTTSDSDDRWPDFPVNLN